MRSLLLLMLSSCATSEPVYIKDPCPAVQLINTEGASFEELSTHAKMAKEGCIRHYGPGACLTKLTRISERNYHAICRRAIASSLRL